MEERCVCCGEIIPEGRQVCPKCQSAVDDTIKPRMIAYLEQMMREEQTKALQWKTASEQLGWEHTHAREYAREHEEHARWLKILIGMVEEKA